MVIGLSKILRKQVRKSKLIFGCRIIQNEGIKKRQDW